MTREEVIEVLKELWRYEKTGKYTDSQIREALKLTIKALEQESCDDCISRSSIKQKLQERHDFYVNTYGSFSDMPQSYKSRVDEISDCIGMVLNEPLVTPAEKAGDKRTTLDEAIKNEEEIAIQQIEKANALDNIPLFGMSEDDIEEIKECYKCSKEHEQLAEWLKELKQSRKQRIGEWQRMSDLPEDEDDRYQCSRCGNVVHYLSKENLYTFNRWCGRCGSNNDREVKE